MVWGNLSGRALFDAFTARGFRFPAMVHPAVRSKITGQDH